MFALGASGAGQRCGIFSRVASPWLAGWGCSCDPGLRSRVPMAESALAGLGACVATAGATGISPDNP